VNAEDTHDIAGLEQGTTRSVRAPAHFSSGLSGPSACRSAMCTASLPMRARFERAETSNSGDRSLNSKNSGGGFVAWSRTALPCDPLSRVSSRSGPPARTRRQILLQRLFSVTYTRPHGVPRRSSERFSYRRPQASNSLMISRACGDPCVAASLPWPHPLERPALRDSSVCC
jgi:hypothetical protein